MTNQFTTAQLTDILLRASDRELTICSQAQKDEWIAEYEEWENDRWMRDHVILDGNPIFFDGEEHELVVMDGQDFRGINPQVLQQLANEDTITACTFVGCNFTGVNLLGTIFEYCDFIDCIGW